MGLEKTSPERVAGDLIQMGSSSLHVEKKKGINFNDPPLNSKMFLCYMFDLILPLSEISAYLYTVLKQATKIQILVAIFFLL